MKRKKQRRSVPRTLPSEQNRKMALRQFQNRTGDVINIKIGGLTIRANPFKDGPFSIKMITVSRQRNGEQVEVDQRWLCDKHGRPLFHGTRRQLDRKLKQYEMGYVKWIMTQGTAAEGL